MKPPEGLAGLAAREAIHHPAPETSELERLRAEVSLLQQEARIRQAINDGLAAAVAEERAAVVAWLREGVAALSEPRLVSLERLLSDMANAIERGEHRREEEL